MTIKLMGSTRDKDNPFVDWLLAELKHRDWTQADLAREMVAQTSIVNNVINRRVALGVDLAKRMAAALGVKQRTLFLVAGLLDDEGDDDAADETFQEIRRILSGLSADRREEALRILGAYSRVVDEGAREDLPAKDTKKLRRTA